MKKEISTCKEEYLKILTEQIRCKKARKSIEKEIENHINDQIEAYKMEGMDEKEAIDATIREMGDPVEAGAALDRVHRTKMPWKDIVFIGILGVLGLILQYLLQNIFGVQEYSIPVNFRKQISFLIVSFVFMIGTCYFDYSWIGYYAKEIMIVMTTGILICRNLFGVMINGSARWISLCGVTFSVPMILMLYVPLYGAILYSYHAQKYKGVIKSLFWMLPGILISMIIPSFITTSMLVFTFGVLFTLAVLKDWYKVSKRLVLVIFWGCILLVPIIMLTYLLFSGKVYQIQRLEWLVSLSQGDNVILDSIRHILTNSSWIGKGEAAGVILLEEHILTYTLSYYGIFAGMVIVGILSALFIHLYSMSVKQKNQMGMFMGTGCACVFLVEFVLYLLENFGILYIGYVGSVYCPFLTYGGSGMIVTFIMLGIILSVNRYEKVYPEAGKKKISVKVTING